MNTKYNSVVVLLSTYNGEAFIQEQIDSLLRQRNVHVNVLIRDDGSTDSTLKILVKYTNLYSNIKLIKGCNEGYVRSFSDLVNQGLLLFKEEQFYAFCDQDDVWLPDKLYNSIVKLKEMDLNKPVLYCSNSYLIDGSGKKIGKFYDVMPNINKANVLIYPTFQGCSMVFNRKAAEEYSLSIPQSGIHDEWMYYICNFLGNIFIDKEPQFLYRIHQGNQIGINKHNTINDFICRAKRLLYTKDPSRKFDLANDFFKKYKVQIPQDSLEILQKYLRYKSSLKSKLELLKDKRFFPTTNNKVERFLEIIHILQNRA